ncbi:MAG TPA: hypothetical protein VIM58_12345 [Candidatus Methylacidiphilales bacterium]
MGKKKETELDPIDRDINPDVDEAIRRGVKTPPEVVARIRAAIREARRRRFPKEKA